VDLALVTAGAGNGPLWTHILPHQPNLNGMRDAGVRADQPVETQHVEDSPGRAASRGEDAGFDAILEGIHQGRISSLICLRDNPIFNAPDSAYVRAAMAKLDLLVVIDEMLTDTAKLAHIVLPDVSVWGKDGTIVNADRRLMRQNAAVGPVEEARPAWLILSQLAQRVVAAGLRPAPASEEKRWHYASAAEIMDDLAGENDLFAEGPYCENSSGIRQPAQHPPQPLVVPVEPPAVDGMPSGNEFTLIAHRGQFTSYEAAQLHKPDADRLHREEYALIHRLDAGRIAAADYDVVVVRGPNGSLEIPLRVSEEMMPGSVFVPLFYDGGAVMSLLDHDPTKLVAPSVTLTLTGRRAEPPPDPVAVRQPEAGGREVIPLAGIVAAGERS
ncbi:MAG: molybdopterin oxidoreductase family protein, partial [Planctomycetaceae bacterium]